MTLVLAARERFKQSQVDAKTLTDRARAQYGKSIKTTRDEHDVTQDAIAETLDLSREQVRRYERYYEDWVREHGTEPDD